LVVTARRAQKQIRNRPFHVYFYPPQDTRDSREVISTSITQSRIHELYAGGINATLFGEYVNIRVAILSICDSVFPEVGRYGNRFPIAALIRQEPVPTSTLLVNS